MFCNWQFHFLLLQLCGIWSFHIDIFRVFGRCCCGTGISGTNWIIIWWTWTWISLVFAHDKRCGFLCVAKVNEFFERLILKSTNIWFHCLFRFRFFKITFPGRKAVKKGIPSVFKVSDSFLFANWISKFLRIAAVMWLFIKFPHI